mmetsp:Transcript_36827/g.41893  ORF Transcript_36827/g.41893 Transcript_36827/m.41893 type:complete len:355 (+) Transcript_36827:42-1106(+)
MEKKILLLFICALFAVGSLASEGVKAKTYNINLDTDPLHRWDDVIEELYNPDVETFIQSLIKQFVPSWLKLPLDFVAPLFLKRRGDLGQEIIGISKKIQEMNPKTSMTEGMAWLLNEIYVLNMGCTSIVGEHEDSHIIHGRNLDYNWPAELSKITFQASFQRGGKTVYHGTMFLSFVGIPTGMKPGAFSISYDERDKDNTLAGNVLSILIGRMLPSWEIRNTLETQTTWENAVEYLSKTSMVAPAYFIVGGTENNQGAVLTRKRTELVDKWLIDTSADRWFLLETNYDHWLPAPSGDDRRDPGNAHMNALGRKDYSTETLFSDVMVENPTRNKHTVYTTIMDSKNDVYETTLWP